MADPILDRAVAARHSFAGAAPAGDLDGLMRGLSQFNSELGQYTDQSVQMERDKRAHNTQLAAEAAAAAADASSPEAVQKAVAADVPAGVPAAYGSVFKESLGALLVDRHAVKAKTEWAAAYEEASKAPDFDAESFIAQQRQKSLAGLTDPGLAGRMSKHLSEMEGAVRTAAEKDRLKKLDEARETGLYSALQENLRPDMTPEQQGEQFYKYSPMWEALGFSKKDLANRLFIRTSQLSDQMGGNPQVFDVFNTVDPKTGQTILSMNPDLALHVDQARQAAKLKNQKMLEEAAGPQNMLTLDSLHSKAEKGELTPDDVLQNFGKLQAVQTPEQGVALLHMARKAREKLAGDADLMAAYDTGILGRYKPEDQKKVLEAKLGGAITEAWKRAVSGDGKAMGQLSALILAEQSRSKSTVPVDAIERLVSSSLSTVQNPTGVTPEFASMAALYRGLSADPKYREMYFKPDEDQLMRAYLRQTDAGSDPNAAYKAAYQSISPEAKEAADKFAKTPEFQKKLQGVVKDVTGMTWWNKYVPFTAMPANSLVVQTAAADEARQFLASHPYADPKEIGEHLSTWTSRNFVFDKNSGTAVRVPAGAADDTMQEALTAYSKKVAEVYRLKDRNDGDWKVQFRSVGDGNTSHVVLSNGSAEQMIGTIPLATLRAAHVADQSATEQDRAFFGTVQNQMRAGKLDLTYLEQNMPALAKARALDLLPKSTLDAIDKARLDQAKQMVDSIPKLTMPTPTLENLAVVPHRAVKVDNKLTAQVALSFLGPNARDDLSLAASLTTMGEAVVLKASPDPAKDAGNNLGMGYNLKANVKNASSDLLRAGVSADKVEAVIRGDAQLTPQQAQKLLLVSLPRYQRQAMDTAEDTAPGLWKRMTPGQRAVMTDIAWQTGSISQFRKAWRALEAGDSSAFAQETKVFFTNAKGQRTEDKRRSELRAAMLNGDSAWLSTIQKYGSFPSNALDAVALNQSPTK